MKRWRKSPNWYIILFIDNYRPHVGIKHCPVIVLNFCISFEFIILDTTTSCCLFSPQIAYLPLASINDVPSRFINKTEVIQWGPSIFLPSDLPGRLYLYLYSCYRDSLQVSVSRAHYPVKALGPIPPCLSKGFVPPVILLCITSSLHSLQCKNKKTSNITYLPNYAISLLTSVVKFLLKMYTGSHLSISPSNSKSGFTSWCSQKLLLQNHQQSFLCQIQGL